MIMGWKKNYGKWKKSSLNIEDFKNIYPLIVTFITFFNCYPIVDHSFDREILSLPFCKKIDCLFISLQVYLVQLLAQVNVLKIFELSFILVLNTPCPRYNNMCKIKQRACCAFCRIYGLYGNSKVIQKKKIYTFMPDKTITLLLSLPVG